VMKAQAQTQVDHARLQSDAAHQQLKLQGEIQLAQRKAELEAQLMLIEAGLRERADRRAQELHVLDLQHRRERHQLEMAKAGLKLAPVPDPTGPNGADRGCTSNQSGNSDEEPTDEPSCACQP